MLHLFHLDVAYVVVAIHVCCKCMFQIFHLFSYVCCKCFIWMLLYVAVVIHICCKRMFQLFHLVSVCCSRCCSPCALTRGHAPIQCCLSLSCGPTLPISIMRASSNSRTSTQWAVSAEMAEHSLVKVHAHMQSARASQRRRTGRPYTTRLGPLGWSM